MNKYDVIFWYTGGAVWIVLAVLFAAAVIIVVVRALHEIHQASYTWKALRAFYNIPNQFDGTEYHRVSMAIIKANKETGVKLKNDEMIRFCKAFNKAYNSDTGQYHIGGENTTYETINRWRQHRIPRRSKLR